ncbi:unnamed protein product [Caenorhabditis auriculariae]|uniref:LIM zinc-binding domain-containing protein n=1 Tax=Caenorhabditis auriculariae TaxID=2777116 RepID=A0A8S1HGF2_9PELO|nr:unnamed protein product [Caenorhabditis auriculariae]
MIDDWILLRIELTSVVVMVFLGDIGDVISERFAAPTSQFGLIRSFDCISVNSSLSQSYAVSDSRCYFDSAHLSQNGAMSYLSPLPHYSTPRLTRARSWVGVNDYALTEAEAWDHRPRLLHPLYSQPQRYYHLANGRQRMHQDVTTIPHLRRPIRPAQQWTLRHYSTQPLVYVRPATTNRFEVTPNQQLSGRDRPNGEKLGQLERHQAREQIPSAPSGSVHSRQVGHLHRPTDPLNLSRDPQSSTSIQNRAPANQSSIYSHSNESINSYSSPYSSSISNISPVLPTIKPTTSTSTSYRFTSTSNDDSAPAKNFHYPNNINSNKNNNNTVKKYGNTTQTVLEWSEPYKPRTSSSPILNPQELIRNFATSNFVVEEGETRKAAPQSREAARSFISNSLAKQLRDEGLTPSQKYANQFQKSQLSAVDTRVASGLPFDAGRIVADSYNGDEVDHLVHQMRNDLHGVSTNPGGDFGRRPLNDLSDSSYQKNTFTRTTTSGFMNSNICVACRGEITSDQPGCNALNQIFHVDCFKCNRCTKVLAGSSFYNIDDRPTCEGCYQDSLEKCSGCGRSISDKLLRACGGTYHVACFVCSSCRKSLDGVPFTLDKENSVHCVPCFHDKFAPRCAVCSRPIIPVEGEKESVRVVAMDKSFHVDCYRCEDCNLQLSSKLEGQGCYPLDSHLFCKTCNGNRLRMLSEA